MPQGGMAQMPQMGQPQQQKQASRQGMIRTLNDEMDENGNISEMDDDNEVNLNKKMKKKTDNELDMFNLGDQSKMATYNGRCGWLTCNRNIDTFNVEIRPHSMSKYASDAQTALFYLIAGGVAPNEAPEIIKQAQMTGMCDIYNIRRHSGVSSMEKKASRTLDSRRIDKLVKVAQSKDVVKLAASLPETESVDSILSLRFIQPENVEQFAKAVPHLDKTESILAALLTAVRLGFDVVKERSVKEALEYVVEIADQLRGLQQSAGQAEF